MLSPSRSLVRGLFAAALLWFVGSAGAALPAGVTAGASVEGISEYALANGLKVLLFPDASQPKVTVNITYLVGSRMENYGETGMAHLLEHMVFKGTKTRGNLMTGARAARHGVQRHDLVRPHQLFRDLPGVRREPRLGAGDGSRPHGQLHRARARTSTAR